MPSLTEINGSANEGITNDYGEVKVACMMLDDPVTALRRLDALSKQGELAPEIGVAARGIFRAVKRREIPRDLATHLKQSRGAEIGRAVAFVAKNGGELLVAGEVPALLKQWWDFETGKAALIVEEFEDDKGSDVDMSEKADDWLCAGLANHDMGKVDKALEAYDKAAKLAPDSHIVQYNRGVALTDLGRFDEALEAYNEATRINPGDAPTHYNKGVVLFEIGRYKDAIGAYDEAMQLDPDDPATLQAKAAALRALSRMDKAQANDE